MDRRCFRGLLLVAAAAIGCSSSSPEAAAPPQPQTAIESSANSTPESAPPLAGQSVDAPAAVAEVPQTFQVEQSLALPTVEETLLAAAPPALEQSLKQPLAPPPAEVGNANPLRSAFAPTDYPSATEDANPLRFRSAPRGAAPPLDEPLSGLPAQPLLEAPAGGGVAAEAPPSAQSLLDQLGAEPLTPGAGAPPAMPLAEATLGFPFATDGQPASAEPLQSTEYDVVEVFYGTDRQPSEALLSPFRLSRYLPLACSVLITVCLGLIACGRRSAVIWVSATVCLLVSLGLAYQATAGTISAVRGIGKQGPRYTTARSPEGHIDVGVCQVSIPKSHAVGEVESPSVLRLEIREDASKHVVLRGTERLADARFYEQLRERVAASPERELFVFVHGFNVSFEDAARRTAQIHYDLKFSGAPIFFSWPAHDKFLITYPADEKNVAWSAPHLKQFLLSVVKHGEARSVNLIAHSMGNRALASALREIQLEMRSEERIFNQVILAAPDIDAAEFRNEIAPAMQRTAKGLTLYASSRDDALLASQLVHRGARAGDAGEGLVVIPGIDTIDVTAIDTSPWGHSYYGSSDPVLHDLQLLLSRALPPRDRSWLSPAERDGLTYWIFQPLRTASAESDSAR
jgi:esterase/lipase superfamily enzyme